MIIAPKIKTASNPSLNIIAKDEINAIVGAIVPVPDTSLSDSSRLRSIAITTFDISPIGDCNKTEVWELGKELKILDEIMNAQPTDGLWDDNRNDEDQLGLSYEQIEEAMKNNKSKYFKKYISIRESNLHKMKPIPVCKFRNE